MQYFANPSTPKVRDAMTSGLLGFIATPKQGNSLIDGVPWCADNGCYGKGYPGDDEWFAWLEAKADRAHDCVFAVAPDVVGDAAATLQRSLPWMPRMRALGYRVAYVGQDGQELLPVPWDEFDVFFVGGSTEWKLGPAARQLIAEAKTRGKHVHMGRVNTLRRLRYALFIGCDSADGTYIARAPRTNLDRMLGFLRAVHQDQLFEETA